MPDEAWDRTLDEAMDAAMRRFPVLAGTPEDESLRFAQQFAFIEGVGWLLEKLAQAPSIPGDAE